MNVSIISGPMSQAPKDCSQPGGNTIARFSVAVKRFGQREEGERDCYFFDCVAFGQPAKFLLDYGKVGDTVVVSGRLEKKQHDGQWYTTIVANDVELPKGGCE